MTRTLSVTDTICGECYTSYDTVEEAAECERLDIDDLESDREDEEFWGEHWGLMSETEYNEMAEDARR